MPETTKKNEWLCLHGQFSHKRLTALSFVLYSVYQNYCDSSLKDHGHYNFKARQLIFNGLVAYPFLPMLLKNGLDWPSFDQVTSVLVQLIQFWLCPYVVKLRPKKGCFLPILAFFEGK